MLLRKGFYRVKVKYGSNQLAKVRAEDGSSLHSFSVYCQHMIELNNLQKLGTVDVYVLYPVAL